jgi:hypothetical protein
MLLGLVQLDFGEPRLGGMGISTVGIAGKAGVGLGVFNILNAGVGV